MKLLRSPISRRCVTLVTAAAASALLPVALLAPLSTQTAGAAPPAAPAEAGRYIVMTKGDPLSSYTGGVQGFTATSPKAGRKLNTRTGNARGYARHLQSAHNEVLRDAGVPVSAKVDDYTVAFNGFAAELSSAQVSLLEKDSAVVHVWRDEQRYADTITTPDFLGMTGSSGVWQERFGGPGKAGEGIIVGVLDSGIWAENPSFAALPEPRPDAADIAAQWHGDCDAGVEQPIACNNKLIGARYYTAGNTIGDHEFISPRDFNGHGSHTSSTAAGNNGVPATINGGSVGNVSGMAPAARLAMYKVLWDTGTGQASGNTSGIVSAIDDAVEDGVDIISYSISGSRTSVVSPDEIAFMFAADAGVFVSTSAGNSGDTIGVSSVAHNSPWEMTVAASSHDRGNQATVTLGNGASYTGVGVSDVGVASSSLIDSIDAKAPGASDAAASLCFSEDWEDGAPAGLDPALVDGKIVVCTRGVNDRVDKSQAVAEAGGVGMVLVNTSNAQSLNGDFHTVPTVHLNATDGATVQSYAKTTGATAEISPRDPTPVRAPEMAGFSSFGPALAGGGDLLKPDITAPGVDVIAAVAPPGHGGNNFNAVSGTSMSTPHISGIAALIRQAHPNWSPMWVKSALMTTATDLDNEGGQIQRTGADASPLDYGNGHVRPGRSFSPGLVYDNDLTDWVQYGCGIGQFQLVFAASVCNSFGSIEPSQLNYPSIAVAGLAGTETVRRTVTNTSPDQASQYKARIEGLEGFTWSFSSSKLTVPPLQSRSFGIRFTRTTAPLGEWAFGTLVWTDKRGHEVRSSIALEPEAVSAPGEVTGTGTSGSQDVDVTAGYTGTLSTSVVGLVPAHVDERPTGRDGITTVDVTVPAGATHVRFATYDADYPAGTDVDLEVLKDGEEVGSSAGATAEEAVNLTGPGLEGTYTVEIDYFAGTPDVLPVQLNSFVLGNADAGNLTVTPASQAVTAAQPASVTLAWEGLAADTRYLGAVDWSDGTEVRARTLVSILR
ncbi:S8 family peptidase [Nocardioides sp.]|uniref:S8 family peptidase n=1 Tax=Nocardioides sp. TaxID=35761 RepID=UPI002ED488BD